MRSSAARAAHRGQARSHICFGPVTPVKPTGTALVHDWRQVEQHLCPPRCIAGPCRLPPRCIAIQTRRSLLAHRSNWPETDVGAGLPAMRRAGGARFQHHHSTLGRHPKSPQLPQGMHPKAHNYPQGMHPKAHNYLKPCTPKPTITSSHAPQSPKSPKPCTPKPKITSSHAPQSPKSPQAMHPKAQNHLKPCTPKPKITSSHAPKAHNNLQPGTRKPNTEPNLSPLSASCHAADPATAL